MRKILKSVFPFKVFPFVRYKILLRFIVLYSIFVSLFFLLFFCEKDDVLFPNAVERNVQSFNLSYAVQNYSWSFHDTKTSISAKTFRPQNSPNFLCKPRTRNSRTNGLKQNEWLFPVVWSREGLGKGGRVSEWRRGWVRERGQKILLLSPSYSLQTLFSSVPHFAPLSTTLGTG